MSVITMSNRAPRRGAASNRGQTEGTIRQADEFDGFWLNVGTMRPDGTFARLNRGIAVSDLQIRQIYETTDPQRKDELTITNAIVKAIQAKANGKKLGEGEFIVLKNLSIVLYRRMEGTEGESTAALDADVEAMLFGDDEDHSDPAAQEAAEAQDAAIEAEVERRMAEKLAASKAKSKASQLLDDDVLGTK